MIHKVILATKHFKCVFCNANGSMFVRPKNCSPDISFARFFVRPESVRPISRSHRVRSPKFYIEYNIMNFFLHFLRSKGDSSKVKPSGSAAQFFKGSINVSVP